VTRIIYVRHGESNSTVAKVIGGPRTCTGLSPLGVQQAERLRDRWRAAPEFAPDLIISSHYPRARRTAEIVAEAFPGVPLTENPGFGEHDPGERCDGMTYVEFVEHYGTQSWEDDPFGVTFPGGETLAQFHYRVGSTVRQVVEEHPEATLLVSCHGGVVDTVLRQALKTAPTGGFSIHTLNTSITELELVASNKWSLRRYGDIAHLAGLPAATNP
jgi:2,3-bisphosphoglycerate-dependent phosphoglycerate mutase